MQKRGSPMKRIFVLLLCACILLSFAACAKEKPAASTEPSTTTAPESSSPPETTQPTSSPDDWQGEYDENGELVKKTRYENGKEVECVYYEKGEIFGREVTTYDVSGNKLELICYRDGKETERYRYTYEGDLVTELYTESGVPQTATTMDCAGRLVMKVDYRQGKPVWRNTYFYDTHGELSGYDSELLGEFGVLRKISLQGGDLWEGIPEGGEEKSSFAYRYNTDGSLAKEDTMPTYSALDYHRFYVYDDSGNLLAIYDAQTGEYYGAGYDEQGRKVWEYHEYGPVSDYETYEYDDATGTYTSQFIGATYGHAESRYDKNGRLTLMVFYGDGAEEFREACTYNEYGDVLQIVHTESLYSQEVTHYTYRYAYQDGKWVTQIKLRDGEAEETINRRYDAQGRLAEETNGETVTTFTYDSLGRLTLKNSTGENAKTWLYHYDEQGRLQEEICFSPED